MDNTRDLMDTAMEHNRKLLSTAMKGRALSAAPAAAPRAPTLSPVTIGPADRKAIIDQQFKDKVKKLQMKYAGKLSPQRMQELHAQANTNLTAGSGLAPSSASVIRRALVAGAPAPTAGTLETSAPFSQLAGGTPLQ
jgi:hypothetical protein